ncbi:MAG: SDR family oxidoreductase [Pseudomonadales bacterium]
MPGKVLVTGVSGFIGSHCAADLLRAGYAVRGSIRDLSRSEAIRSALDRQGVDTTALEFCAATLSDWECWQPAAEGCDAIFHVASPVPTIQPRNADDVVLPARDGTLNVLAAARAQGINRVVLTSSVAAIMGSIADDRVYTAADWSDTDDPRLTPYALSKTVAERAAWDFCETAGIGLTTVNPALVLGPAMETDYGSSLEAVVKLMKREVPFLPRFGFEIVDVRDVAALHRLALENDAAVGQRLIAANGFRWFREIAAVLHEQYPEIGIPLKEMPNWLTHLVGLFVREIGSFIDDLDRVKRLDNAPAMDLGWAPSSPEDAILAAAASLQRLGIA